MDLSGQQVLTLVRSEGPAIVRICAADREHDSLVRRQRDTCRVAGARVEAFSTCWAVGLFGEEVVALLSGCIIGCSLVRAPFNATAETASGGKSGERANGQEYLQEMHAKKLAKFRCWRYVSMRKTLFETGRSERLSCSDV